MCVVILSMTGSDLGFYSDFVKMPLSIKRMILYCETTFEFI